MSKNFSITVRLDGNNKRFLKKLERQFGGISNAVRHLIYQEKQRQEGKISTSIGDINSVKIHQLLRGLLIHYYKDSKPMVEHYEKKANEILDSW